MSPLPQAAAKEKYEEVKQLGKGSYGSVFLVRDRTQRKRAWVMKRIALRGLAVRERQSAFQEAKLLRELHHPHICSYQDSFIDRATNQLCLVMTFCSGGDLHRKVQGVRKMNQTVPESQVVTWMLQLTLALQYIHDRHSIIHRDLKTQNVFLMEDGSLKLGDFGVSRVLDSPTDLARTCVGTPFYMCPELMRKQRYSNSAPAAHSEPTHRAAPPRGTPPEAPGLPVGALGHNHQDLAAAVASGIAGSDALAWSPSVKPQDEPSSQERPVGSRQALPATLRSRLPSDWGSVPSPSGSGTQRHAPEEGEASDEGTGEASASGLGSAEWAEAEEEADEEQQRELEMCENTLSACELNIQLLRATLVPEARAPPQPGEAADELSDEALTATLPPPRYGTGHAAPPPQQELGQEEEGDEEAKQLAAGQEAIDGALEEALLHATLPPPPELHGRGGALREACLAGLGQPTFDKVYRYLLAPPHDPYSPDYDELMRQDLLGLMGESKVRLWPLVDQLLYCDEAGHRAVEVR